MPTLDWIGKKAVEKHHLEIPFRMLKSNPDLSVGNTDSGNLIVQGDNLEALKALLPYYAGQVKCICIDPPYNTGNEGWAYNDNVKSPEIIEWLNKVVGKEGEDLSRHDKWLCMLYPRLQLLRQFLREDGTIFINIDDNEQGNLRLIMDEIFGPNNFVTNIIWQKKFSPQNDAKYFSDNHDFILVYAKKKSVWKRNLLPRNEGMNSRYKNPDNDPRGVWASSDLSVKTYSKEYDYPITTPSGKVISPTKGRCWRTSKTNLQKLIEENRIWFGPKGNGVPRIKRFLTDVQEGFVPLTIWLHQEVGHNQQARQELKQIFPDYDFPFETPKPISLIKRILQIATFKDSIILDSFAGSGSTGHAVLSLNEEDNGNRKFILVEIENEICEKVTSERIKRVIGGKYNKSSTNLEDIRLTSQSGFKYCILDKPIFDEIGNIRSDIKFIDLAYHIFFSETGTPLSQDAKIGKSPLISVFRDTAYYLLFNGILGDKSLNGGNILSSKILEKLPKFKGQKIIFGEGCRLSSARLKKENIIFKQLPYELKIS